MNSLLQGERGTAATSSQGSEVELKQEAPKILVPSFSETGLEVYNGDTSSKRGAPETGISVPINT